LRWATNRNQKSRWWAAATRTPNLDQMKKIKERFANLQR
jgi:hypothetical protein